jgi:hypothetical protein
MIQWNIPADVSSRNIVLQPKFKILQLSRNAIHNFFGLLQNVNNIQLVIKRLNNEC